MLSRENKDDLSPGVKEAVRVWIAQTRKISVGDKMQAATVTRASLPASCPKRTCHTLEDGTPVDIILNPIGVPSGMNLGKCWKRTSAGPPVA